MNAETDRDLMGHLLDAQDAISTARATLELLFYAGEGMKAVGIAWGAGLSGPLWRCGHDCRSVYQSRFG